MLTKHQYYSMKNLGKKIDILFCLITQLLLDFSSRWSGKSRDWTMINEVNLNPEKKKKCGRHKI